MASVSWNYPQDRLIALRGTNAAAAAASPVANGVDVARLNFRYRIEGDNAPWRPVRAFDDSDQVFIEFPAGIGQGEIPPLFVIGHNGGRELVTYRIRERSLFIDVLFSAAQQRICTQ